MSSERRSATAHSKPRRSAGGSGLRDIGQFVETYNHLQDKLYPVFAVWDLALYVTRWENYLLTLAAILVLSLLLYFPSVLCSLLTLAAILVMAVGRYHGQTKTLVELKKTPVVELLDPDQHLLRKQHSEQEHMHRSRLDFRQILSNAEVFMLNAERVLDYMCSVYLWKSPEVSLCVTVLLCLVLVLLCTVDLHTIGAAIPPIVLCTNRHFFSKSIDLWKLLLGRLKHRLDMRKRARTESQLSAKKSGSHEETEREEEEKEMEEREAEMEHGPVINPPRIPEERESSNEAGFSDTTLTPELRQRTSLAGSQVSTETTATAADTVSRSGEGVADADSWIPIQPGPETPQLTRKDGKSTQQEVCSKCKTSSFFLKRKYNCNMCGQTFCGSCTIKVKKAALGVTSPAAEMTVRVCMNCKAKLDHIPMPNATPHS